MFLKRQWILGKRFGYVTPGEMLADYFKGDMVRVLTVVVALCFSVPYLGLQLAASGKLFNVLSDGMWGVTTGTWVLAGIVALYVGLGGLRSVAYVDTSAMCTSMVWNCSNWFYYVRPRWRLGRIERRFSKSGFGRRHQMGSNPR